MSVAAKSVDGLFEAWDRTDSPGCAVGVVDHGELVCHRCLGMADLSRGWPISPDSRFYVASVSKQFTAACAVLLAQDGRLGLDDDIRTCFPELPQYEQTITVRHLLHHTSGLRDVLTLWELAGKSFEAAFTDADTLALLARQQGVNFAPGERHMYCNSGYGLLAGLVARTTGQSLRTFAQERIFASLGMDCTFFDDTNEALDQRVQSYAPAEEGGFTPVHKRFTIVGSGGLVTTMGDLARWDHNFYEPVVGGPEFLQTMHTTVPLNDGSANAYACGLIMGEHSGLPTVSHSGGMLGFRTHMLRFPDERLTVVCLANLSNVAASALAAQVADLYLADRYPLEPWAGAYHSTELDSTWELAVDGAHLALRQPAALACTFQHSGTDEFCHDGTRLEFERDPPETVTGFVVQNPRAQGVRFRKVPSPT